MADETRLFKVAEEIGSKSPAFLSYAQQIFRLIWELEAEVNNGGFQQYFYNSSGRDAPNVETALRTVGAHKCADLAAQAFGVVDATGLEWADDERRQAHVERIDANAVDELDALDAKFFEYPDPLSPLLAKFVDAHPEDFGS
jgi:hypothetical protein